jgi:hypothetical protein
MSTVIDLTLSDRDDRDDAESDGGSSTTTINFTSSDDGHNGRPPARRQRPLAAIPPALLSVDIGHKNCGVACIRKGVLTYWQRHDLDISKASPQDTATAVVAFVDKLLAHGFREEGRINAIAIIEKQVEFTLGRNHRTTMKNHALEVAFHTAFRARGLRTESFNPKLPQELFTLAVGNYGQKKRDAIARVVSLLNGTGQFARNKLCHIPLDYDAVFARERKKDDLADCLLQALTYIAHKRTKKLQ